MSTADYALINKAYRLLQCIRRAADFELWSAVHVRGRAQNEISRGLLLLVEPDRPLDQLNAIWQQWRLRQDARLARCAANGVVDAETVHDGTDYSRALFAYVETVEDASEMTSDPLICVWSILQSVIALQEQGLSCAKIEDWMFVPTEYEGKTTCRLMPVPCLYHASDRHELLRIAGNYLQRHFSGLPQPWSGLLLRLLDGTHPPDIGPWLDARIWQSPLGYSCPEGLIQTSRNGAEHTVTWQPPAGKTVFLLRGDVKQLSRFRENFVYSRSEILSCGREIPVSGHSVALKIEATETVTVVPFLVSESLFQCLGPLTLGGLEDVEIKKIYRDPRMNELVLELDWPPDIGAVVVIVGNERFAESATDIHGQTCFHRQYVKQKIVQPVRCPINFSGNLFVSIFSCRQGTNGTEYSRGQRRSFVF